MLKRANETGFALTDFGGKETETKVWDSSKTGNPTGHPSHMEASPGAQTHPPHPTCTHSSGVTGKRALQLASKARKTTTGTACAWPLALGWIRRESIWDGSIWEVHGPTMVEGGPRCSQPSWQAQSRLVLAATITACPVSVSSSPSVSSSCTFLEAPTPSCPWPFPGGSAFSR